MSEVTPAHPSASFTVAGVDVLTALSAIEEIRTLKSDYFTAVDDKDWAAIEDMFTADAVVDFAGEGQHHVGHHGFTADQVDGLAGTVVGGADTAALIAAAVNDVVSVHFGHDPSIRITGTQTASGRWSMYDRLEYDSGEVMHGFGNYHETYRRVDGRWRFSSLTLTRRRVLWSNG